MSLKTSVEYFQTLVTSFHPVVVIDTVEEERVQGLISSACNDMQMAVFEWTVAQGLMRSPDSPDHRWQNEYAPPGAKRGQALPKTAEPLDMLRHIQDINVKAIYWLKDFAPPPHRPGGSPAVSSKLNAEPDASTTSTWASQTRTVAAPLPWPRPWLPAFSGSTKSKKAWAKPAVRPMVD